jgi:hypothetical protein
MCFVITRGLSEIYDILTHMTFLVVEARKIHSRMTDDSGSLTIEWKRTGKIGGPTETVRRCRPGPGLVEPEHHIGPSLPGNP